MYLRIEYGCGAYGGCKVIQRPFPLLGSRNLTKNVSLRTGVKLANGAPWLEATLSQRGKRGIWLDENIESQMCLFSWQSWNWRSEVMRRLNQGREASGAGWEVSVSHMLRGRLAYKFKMPNERLYWWGSRSAQSWSWDLKHASFSGREKLLSVIYLTISCSSVLS